MKIIFSRKGLDSGAGGAPSPFLDGYPFSLPAPIANANGDYCSGITYDDLGLGEHIERQTRNRILRFCWCHPDPAFANGQCAFGQTGNAQKHLSNRGVGEGDVFLFFGLFENPNTSKREHWLFGYLRIQQVVCLGSDPCERCSPSWLPHRHPNTIGPWHSNNTLYLGEGRATRNGSPRLRLTAPGGMTSRWAVPAWLHSHRQLSYHGDNEDVWLPNDILQTAKRGQEFVCDIAEAGPQPETWVEEIIGIMRE